MEPWRRLSETIFGWDFFISYAHSDGTQYPTELHNQLCKAGFKCFLDQSTDAGFSAGEELLPETLRKVRLSSCLVLIARPAALQSSWVRREVEACIAAKKRLVVIDVNSCLRSGPREGHFEDALLSRVSIPEALPGGWDGEPSAASLQRLQHALLGTRKRIVQRRTALALVGLFAVLIALSGVLYNHSLRSQQEAVSKQLMAFSNRLGENARVIATEHPQRALLLAIEGTRILERYAVATFSSVALQALQNSVSLTQGSLALQGSVNAEEHIALFSSNGRHIAMAGSDGTVSVWRLTSSGPGPKSTIKISDRLRLAKFTEDGEQLIVGGANGGLALSSASDGFSSFAWLRKGAAHTGVLDVVSNHLTILASFSSGEVLSWKRKDLTMEPKLLWRQEEPVRHLAQAPNGRWLATGSDNGAVSLFDLAADRSQPALLVTLDAEVIDLVFSPDGKWLAAASGDGTATLIPWRDLDSATSYRIKIAFSGVPYADMEFSPDGQWLAASSTYEEIEVWSLEDGVSHFTTFEGSNNGNASPAFSPDSRWLAAGGADGRVRIWLVESGRLVVKYFYGVEGEIYTVQIGPQQKWMLAAGSGSKGRLWSLDGKAAVPQSYQTDAYWLSEPLFSSDQRRLIWVGPEGCFVQDLTLKQAITTKITSEGCALTWGLISRSGRFLAGVDDGEVVIIDLESQPLQRHATGLMWDEALTFEFSDSEAALMVAQHNGQTWTCGVTNGLCVRGYSFPVPDSLPTVSFDPLGQLVAMGSTDGDLLVASLDPAGQILSRLQKHSGQPLRKLAFSPKGNWLASVDSFGQVCVQRRGAWEESSAVCTPTSEGSDFRVFEFSADENWLVVGESPDPARPDQPSNAWLFSRAAHWRKPQTLRGHDGEIISAAFDPGGRWIATGSWDRTVHLWPLGGQASSPRVFRGFDLPTRMVEFDAEGRGLWVITGPSTVTVWPLAVDGLIEAACLSAGRNLSREEWATYLSGPYRETCVVSGTPAS